MMKNKLDTLELRTFESLSALNFQNNPLLGISHTLDSLDDNTDSTNEDVYVIPNKK